MLRVEAGAVTSGPPEVVAREDTTGVVSKRFDFFMSEFEAELSAQERRVERFMRELEAARKTPSFQALGRYLDSTLDCDSEHAYQRVRKYFERTREVNSACRVSVHKFPVGLNGEIRKRYVVGHCKRCNEYAKVYGELPNSFVPLRATNGVKVVHQRTGTTILYPNGSVTHTFSLRGLFTREFWAALRDPHTELVSVHGTLPSWFASGRTLKLLRRVKNRRMRLPWGNLVFGDRSDPRNVEIELNSLLVKRITDSKARVRRLVVRHLLGKVLAYAEAVLRRFFDDVVTLLGMGASSVRARNTLSSRMGELPANSRLNGPPVPAFG